MKSAIIYSFNTKKTAKIAQQLKDLYSSLDLELVNAETIDEETFLSFDQLILGVPTWFDGELPNYWDEFVPALEDLDLKGKKIALYGLGDQKGYPENFQDGMGILAKILENRGAEIVGFTSAKGYEFEKSLALRGDEFVGLAIDYENQGSKNKTRIQSWVKSLELHFT